MLPEPINQEKSNLDFVKLNRLLDRTKMSIFVGSNSAFFAPLMCSMNFVWTEGLKRAATDYVSIFWNPHWFLELTENARGSILLHELYHPGSLHGLRLGDRDPDIWNYACDYVINLRLHDDGYQFDNANPALNLNYRGMSEEEIYDDLINSGFTVPIGTEPDMLPLTDAAKQKAMNNVVQAMNQAKLSDPGSIPKGLESLIKGYMTHTVPWEIYLHRWMNELLDKYRTWRKPNRRYPRIYLPSMLDEDGKLESLTWYFDVSGSITDNEIRAMVGQMIYIKTTYQPKKMTIVLFDTEITKEFVVDELDNLVEMIVIGRGGTDLEPVRQHIRKTEPTAAVIFSDLFCTPMQPIENDIPVLWVSVNNKHAQVPFGQLIHMKV